MATAYVLINCELDSKKKVFSQLRLIGRIKEMREVFGAYDIVTKIEAASVDIIKDIATQIRGLDRIRSTITLLSNEKENQY